MDFPWGTEIGRRSDGVPFLVYSPRRSHVCDLLSDAARWADRTHLVQGTRRLSFAEVFARVEATAAVAHEQGVRAGDRVLLLAPNSVEWVISFWAGLRLGAVVAVGNSWWSAAEIAHAVDLVRPALVLADPARLANVPADAPSADLMEVYDRRPSGTAPVRPTGHEDDPALIVFTAGTTGFAKGVVLAHRSVIANLHNLLAVSGRLPQNLDPTRTPAVVLQSGPLFHMGGVQSLLLGLLSGSTTVFLSGRFDPGEVLELVERERVTVWGAVPAMAARVLEHPDLPRRDVTSVRSISMGGAPVQPRLLESLREHFTSAKRGLSTIYGMTETGGTVTSASGALMAEHPQTAGRALPVVELRIENPDADGVGEIVVRTPGQMVGYWGQEGADLLDADGFVHTGDLGRLHDGLLFVTGRSKELIIRGGENIAPVHVESALLTHPAVRSAAVLGRPDEVMGEIVAAAVQVDSPVTAEELAAHVAPLLSKFAVPVQWWIGTEPLAMTDAGKTDKRRIAALWPGPI
ncbi:MAG: class I adenylate-forming enzyme family protein [Sporichthyaceae bacterium]